MFEIPNGQLKQGTGFFRNSRILTISIMDYFHLILWSATLGHKTIRPLLNELHRCNFQIYFGTVGAVVNTEGFKLQIFGVYVKFHLADEGSNPSLDDIFFGLVIL